MLEMGLMKMTETYNSFLESSKYEVSKWARIISNAVLKAPDEEFNACLNAFNKAIENYQKAIRTLKSAYGTPEIVSEMYMSVKHIECTTEISYLRECVESKQYILIGISGTDKIPVFILGKVGKAENFLSEKTNN